MILIGEWAYLYRVVFYVEIASDSSQVSGKQIASSLIESDHFRFVQEFRFGFDKFCSMLEKHWIILQKKIIIQRKMICEMQGRLSNPFRNITQD